MEAQNAPFGVDGRTRSAFQSVRGQNGDLFRGAVRGRPVWSQPPPFFFITLKPRVE